MILTILICKIILFFGNIVGRGSTLPGQIALKLNRPPKSIDNALQRIKHKLEILRGKQTD